MVGGEEILLIATRLGTNRPILNPSSTDTYPLGTDHINGSLTSIGLFGLSELSLLFSVNTTLNE